jgi:hypothetical protein
MNVRDERADAVDPWSTIWIRRNGSPGVDRLVRVRRQYRRYDLEVAFADVPEGAAVGQGKIIEPLAAKGAGDHPAPMALVANRRPQFQHPLPTPQRQTRLPSLVSGLSARPPATATIDAVDGMSTGIDRPTAATRAKPRAAELVRIWKPVMEGENLAA